MSVGKSNSLLIGNGLDVQVGGDDYQNKWIMVRLLAKAKAGKYDVLFMNRKDAMPTFTGNDIVNLFNGMLDIANRARENKYDHLVKDYSDKDVLDALEDFKQNHVNRIISVEDIGMEDWILIFQLFLIEQKDLLEQYEAIKQGFERMVLDAIYCEGNIQSLHSLMPESAKSYFSIFNNIFTLNYDNTIEKLTKHTVFHLHGEYSTKSISEDSHNVLGYCRKQSGKSIWFPPQFKHCNCNAILDFSGNRKYNFATRETKAFLEFEKFKESVSNNKSRLEHMLEKFPVEQQQIIQSGVEKDLQCGHDYHFQDFEQLTGTLTIIGLAPKNDRHIFSCINKSNIKEVVFNHYFGEKSKDEVNEIIKNMTLPINKPYKIENVQDIWDEIKVCKPEKRTYELSEAQMDVLNALCYRNPITMDEISLELKSIPTFTKKVIFETMSHEISKSQYHTTPESEEKLFQHFINFGNALQPVSISPQALYCLYLTRMQSDNIKRTHKSSKRLKK